MADRGSNVAELTESLLWVRGEIPDGLIDGNNRLFYLKKRPLTKDAVALYYNGSRQDYKIDFLMDWTHNNGHEILTMFTPQVGDTLYADYPH